MLFISRPHLVCSHDHLLDLPQFEPDFPCGKSTLRDHAPFLEAYVERNATLS